MVIVGKTEVNGQTVPRYAVEPAGVTVVGRDEERGSIISLPPNYVSIIMTSSNGIIFRVTGHLCG